VFVLGNFKLYVALIFHEHAPTLRPCQELFNKTFHTKRNHVIDCPPVVIYLTLSVSSIIILDIIRRRFSHGLCNGLRIRSPSDGLAGSYLQAIVALCSNAVPSCETRQLDTPMPKTISANCARGGPQLALAPSTECTIYSPIYKPP